MPHRADRARVPGPGHYEPYGGEAALSLERLRHSSAFSRTSLDRFGRPVVPKAQHVPTPGPGAYAVPPAGLVAAASGGAAGASGATAVFVSATARQSSLEPGAGGTRVAVPGPAYYNPALPSRKSFNLNSARRWV